LNDKSNQPTDYPPGDSGKNLERSCAAVGLIASVVRTHERRIKARLSGESAGLFEIETPCRLENGGILSLSFFDQKIRDFSRKSGAGASLSPVAFIPAAGAASRFLEPLKPLATALSGGDREAVENFVKEAMPSERPWPLPRQLSDFFDQVPDRLPVERTREILEVLSWPKAMFPCNQSGVTFLEAKSREHAAYRAHGVAFCGEVYVAPARRHAMFEASLTALKSGESTVIPHHVVEQDATLSTLRFRRDGSWVTGSDGNASMVPAGHGALVGLFPVVRKAFPRGDYLLIRNVDNVCGTAVDVCEEVARFCDFSSALIRAVRTVRQFATSRDWNVPALRDSLGFMLSLCPRSVNQDIPATEAGCRVAMARIQRELFHSLSESRGTDPEMDQLIAMFRRPVNVLGQVPNSGKDVGGTPVFARNPGGAKEKVCLEIAHVSADQVDSVLRKPAVATHFNPVFVASELVDDFSGYSGDNSYWSCVQKKFEGEDVFYHESFLYEILGSSSLSNVVFVEIPRSLFNPHKTLSDAASTSVKV
jgi:hypothetical protein